MTQSRTRGNTLVSLLATLAIIAVLSVALFYGSGAFGGEKKSARPDGKGTTVLGAAKYAAKDDVCRSNLGQVRSALQIVAMTNEDQPPADIKETKLPSEFYVCPVGGEAYEYNPADGLVKCPHPGHGKY